MNKTEERKEYCKDTVGLTKTEERNTVCDNTYGVEWKEMTNKIHLRAMSSAPAS